MSWESEEENVILVMEDMANCTSIMMIPASTSLD